MALQKSINYKGAYIEDAYLKIEHVTVDNNTKRTMFSFSVYTNDSILFNSVYHGDIDNVTDISLEYLYTHVKELGITTYAKEKKTIQDNLIIELFYETTDV